MLSLFLPYVQLLLYGMHRFEETAWPLRPCIELRRRADPGGLGIYFSFHFGQAFRPLLQ